MKKEIKIAGLLLGIFLISSYLYGGEIPPEDVIIKETLQEVSTSENKQQLQELENLRVGKEVLTSEEVKKYLNKLVELDAKTLIKIADIMAKKAAKIGKPFWVEQDIGIILGALLKKYQRGEVSIETSIIKPLNNPDLSKNVKSMICELCYEPSNFKKEDIPKIIDTLKSLSSTLSEAKQALKQLNIHGYH